MIDILKNIPNFEDNKTIALFEEFDALDNQDYLSKE
jgi:hypothetical protein